MCASGWKEKDHHRKLQWITLPQPTMLTCTDACPGLCTLRPGLCTLHFYQPMQVLHLHTWWWSLDATCAGGIFPSAIGANTPCTGSGGCSCMLLLHPVLTSTDAAPDLCTLCPDLWALCLWCFPFFNWYKFSTCTGGGCHQLQLAQLLHLHSGNLHCVMVSGGGKMNIIYYN